MKKNYRVLLIFILLFLFSAFQWKDMKVKVLSQKKSALGEIIYLLKDKKGNEFEIFSQGELKEEQVENILILKNRIFSWQEIKVKKLRFFPEKNHIQIVISPSAFTYKDENIASFVPGGIALSWTPDSFNYEFRILKEEKSVRIKGKVSEGNQFIQKIGAYAQKPIQDKDIPKDGSAVSLDEKKNKGDITRNESSDIEHYIRIYLGSGALASLGYGFFWNGFEFNPSAGFVSFPETNVEKKQMGVVFGGRLAYYVLRLNILETYLFGGGFYGVEIENYKPEFIWMGGVGQVVFRYFYAEFSYLKNQNGGGMVLGLGIRIIL